MARAPPISNPTAAARATRPSQSASGFQGTVKLNAPARMAKVAAASTGRDRRMLPPKAARQPQPHHHRSELVAEQEGPVAGGDALGGGVDPLPGGGRGAEDVHHRPSTALGLPAASATGGPAIGVGGAIHGVGPQSSPSQVRLLNSSACQATQP